MKRASLILTSVVFILCSCANKDNYPDLKLWYKQPAEVWTDALPVGNGRLGAMIYGDVATEHIQFNEETLWSGEPHQYSRDDAHKYLDEIRQLLFDGKQSEAEKLASDHFMSKPLQQRSYQPFGDLYISFKDHDLYTDYKRELNIRDGLHKVSYSVGDVTYTREVLASKPDDIIAIELKSDKKGKLGFFYWLDAEHEKRSVVIDKNSMTLNVAVSDGINDRDNTPYKSALHGSSRIEIETDGDVKEVDGKLDVANASYATLYLTAATNYKDYNDVSGKPDLIVDDILGKIDNKSYKSIKNSHVSDYDKLFNRFQIDLGRNSKESLPTDVRLDRFDDEIGDPGLIALYVQFGRYLMLASSREGTFPANLQGVWNDQLTPAWDSKYTTNINAEMNYWMAESANLSECHDSFFNMIEQIAESGAITAKGHYNAPGWCLHHNTDIWRGTAPINASNHGIFLGGGGWVSLHLWEHYLYTMDKGFLKDRGYPLMRGAAQFYNHILIKDPKTGWLVSSPTNSPEIGGLVYGAAMDHQIIRSLFKACIEASDILDIDKEFASELQDKLNKIAPDQIGKHNQLQEWVEDKDDINSKHRHVSHLWGVHPGKEINWEDNPELMKAAMQSLEYRGDDGTGWSLAWKINFWARFKNAERAYKMVELLFRHVNTSDEKYNGGGGSYSNLFCAHPPFQIDGNFGGAAGIIEMLIQSHMNYIELLPALPSLLPEGSLSGVCARGGFELSFNWKEGKIEKVHILSKEGGCCRIKYGDTITEIETLKGGEYNLEL